MNIHEYERRVEDPALVKAGCLAMFYEASRRPTGIGAGTVMGPVDWEKIPEHGREWMERLLKAAWLAAVDDYSTPGCSCAYCAWERDSREGPQPLIMCTNRWWKLPRELRIDIGESIAD